MSGEELIKQETVRADAILERMQENALVNLTYAGGVPVRGINILDEDVLRLVFVSLFRGVTHSEIFVSMIALGALEEGYDDDKNGLLRRGQLFNLTHL